MLCIISPSNDPCFNLAAEEHLFKNIGDDVLFLYINTPAVVVGKHQNSMAEINPIYVYENKIPVIRRMSGGGAVYHDSGNLNFSFHKMVEDTAKVLFKSFNIPVVNLLRQLGVPAEIGNRNDIVVNEFKVSGHAQHVFRNKVLSHGTLLIDSDLEKLSTALQKGSGSYESKAIQSVRSKVANVSSFLSKPLAAEEFMGVFNHYILLTVAGAKEYHFIDSEINEITELAQQKYSTWGWNFGCSPSYRFSKKMNFSSLKFLSCILAVEKGIINDVSFEGNALTETSSNAIKEGLMGQPHHPEFLKSFLERENILPVPSCQFIELFF
jgi:lipoate-protein ligase A